MTFFIALTFSTDSLSYQKIDSFRRRFDSKYWKGPSLHLSLLPPFRLARPSLSKLGATLTDEIDNYMQDLFAVSEVNFSGIDFTNGRKSTLFLLPHMPIDLIHCSESLFEILLDEGAHFKKRKEYKGDYTTLTDRVFLPIGRFSDPFLTEAAVETARSEFPDEFSLKADSITLFENTPNGWSPRRKLFTFSREHDNLWEESIGFGLSAPLLARG